MSEENGKATEVIVTTQDGDEEVAITDLTLATRVRSFRYNGEKATIGFSLQIEGGAEINVAINGTPIAPHPELVEKQLILDGHLRALCELPKTAQVTCTSYRVVDKGESIAYKISGKLEFRKSRGAMPVHSPLLYEEHPDDLQVMPLEIVDAIEDLSAEVRIFLSVLMTPRVNQLELFEEPEAIPMADVVPGDAPPFNPDEDMPF